MKAPLPRSDRWLQALRQLAESRGEDALRAAAACRRAYESAAAETERRRAERRLAARRLLPAAHGRIDPGAALAGLRHLAVLEAGIACADAEALVQRAAAERAASEASKQRRSIDALDRLMAGRRAQLRRDEQRRQQAEADRAWLTHAAWRACSEEGAPPGHQEAAP